jgi:dUTP pyrophosphatase
MNELTFFSAHDPGIQAPARQHDAGYDLVIDTDVCLPAKALTPIPLDLFVAIPDGHVGMIKDRSGMARGGIHVFGGVIDSGYRGRVTVLLYNTTERNHRIGEGDRIAQLLIVPIATPTLVRVDSVADLGHTERGANGFGSTDGDRR